MQFVGPATGNGGVNSAICIRKEIALERQHNLQRLCPNIPFLHYYTQKAHFHFDIFLLPDFVQDPDNTFKKEKVTSTRKETFFLPFFPITGYSQSRMMLSNQQYIKKYLDLDEYKTKPIKVILIK